MQEPQQVVSTIPSLFTSSDLVDKAEGSYDVIVCGGTLGIFIATALCARGLRVAIVERNVLKGVILAALRHQILGWKNSIHYFGRIQLVWVVFFVFVVFIIIERTRMEHIKKRASGTCRSWNLGRRWHWKSHSSKI